MVTKTIKTGIGFTLQSVGTRDCYLNLNNYNILTNKYIAHSSRHTLAITRPIRPSHTQSDGLTSKDLLRAPGQFWDILQNSNAGHTSRNILQGTLSRTHQSCTPATIRREAPPSVTPSGVEAPSTSKKVNLVQQNVIRNVRCRTPEHMAAIPRGRRSSQAEF